MVFLASGCEGGSVKQTLGIDSGAPDEFKVVSRPPLSVPPQFSLRPPAVGESSANPNATDKQAESLVMGRPVDNTDSETFKLKSSAADTSVIPVGTAYMNKAGKTTAESQFLQKAGAQSIDPTVRQTLVEEKIMRQEKLEEASWWDWMTLSPDKKETLVDAKKEAERIEKNEKEGKPANDGETATVKPKDRGVLGYILGD